MIFECGTEIDRQSWQLFLFTSSKTDSEASICCINCNMSAWNYHNSSTQACSHPITMGCLSKRTNCVWLVQKMTAVGRHVYCYVWLWLMKWWCFPWRRWMSRLSVSLAGCAGVTVETGAGSPRVTRRNVLPRLLLRRPLLRLEKRPVRRHHWTRGNIRERKRMRVSKAFCVDISVPVQ